MKKRINLLVLSLLLVFGAQAAYPQCSLLYTFTGEALDDVFGMSVSGAGDVNDDGFDDLIIGAPGNDAAGLFAGRAYVYSGMDGSLLYMFTGATDHDFFGTTVSGAGDVNNDGYDDLIIGASQATGIWSWGAGIAYVYSGADGSLLYTFTGEAEDDRFGMYHISGAGDVNNDGFADVIVGASYNDALGNRTGRAYVFYGGEGPFPITVLASDADMIFTGSVIDGGLGFSVSDAGDVNNDDYDDLFVGAWNPYGTAKAYVYSGLDGSVLYNLIAETQGDAFGFSVSAGDLNNDGIVDFVVGAYRNNTAGHYAGRAYAFYGRPEPFPITINAADADLIFTGEYADDQFGLDVSIAGDANCDGYDDIIVGADGYNDPYNWSGRAYVYSGIDGTLLCILRSEGESEYDEFGISVSGAGDVNNDGLPDVIIGARQGNNSGCGKAYVYIMVPTIVMISLDIKPGSCPNPLNVKAPKTHGLREVDENPVASKAGPHGPKKKKAVLPVAILGTVDFNVTDIDPMTVMLEGVPALRWNVEDVSTPVGEDAEECECNTLGPDGYPDLTLKFNKSLIVETLGEVYDGDTIPLTVTGELNDGTSIEGIDCVVIRGSHKTGEGVAVSKGESPTVTLLGNYPNPFNPITEISFSLPAASHVKLEIYNIMGQKVATLVDGTIEAGEHTIQWDGSEAASGVYMYRLEAGEFVDTKKMILLK